MTREELVKKLREVVTVQLNYWPCSDSIEGSFASGEEDVDRDNVQWVRDQLRDGNEWAWCDVKVTVTWKDWKADSTLCACTYESEKDFRESGYYSDLVDECLNGMATRMFLVVEELQGLGVIPC